MDQLLIDSGLFGKGLVPIDTPQGVRRYNDALVDLGITPTGLSKFNIDGMGWSPEIAAERGDTGYLGHGEANRIAIIATPDQDRKPIHLPTFSFERQLLRNFFERSKREIADITTSACVRLELENDILEFESPKDLLELETVDVYASAGELMHHANEQKRLAAEFMLDRNWTNSVLRERIMHSAAAHGDLRRRRTEIPKLPFSLSGNFWTRAFGGVFVLRAGADSILVVEDKRQLAKIRQGENDRFEAFALGNEEAVECLMREDFFELDLRRYQTPEGQKELELLEFYLMVDAVCRTEPDCDFDLLTSSKRKGILLSAEKRCAELNEIRRFKRALEQRLEGKIRISTELSLLLLHPNAMLTGVQHQAILWMLLQRLQENPVDVLTLYTYDKERFFALFSEWTPAKKRWAAKYVSANYVPEMNRN
jgi:hypothetical protein